MLNLSSLKASIMVAVEDADVDARDVTVESLLEFLNDHQDSEAMLTLGDMSDAINELICDLKLRVRFTTSGTLLESMS